MIQLAWPLCIMPVYMKEVAVCMFAICMSPSCTQSPIKGNREPLKTASWFYVDEIDFPSDCKLNARQQGCFICTCTQTKPAAWLSLQDAVPAICGFLALAKCATLQSFKKRHSQANSPAAKLQNNYL